MTTTNYVIANDVDPNVPNSFPIGGVVVGVDKSGLLAPKAVQIDTDLFLVSPAGTYTQAALDTLFIALTKATGLIHDGAGGGKQVLSAHVAVALPAAALTPLAVAGHTWTIYAFGGDDSAQGTVTLAAHHVADVYDAFAASGGLQAAAIQSGGLGTYSLTWEASSASIGGGGANTLRSDPDGAFTTVATAPADYTLLTDGSEYAVILVNDGGGHSTGISFRVTA